MKATEAPLTRVTSGQQESKEIGKRDEEGKEQETGTRKRCSGAEIMQSVRFAQHLLPVSEQLEQDSLLPVSTKRTQQLRDDRK